MAYNRVDSEIEYLNLGCGYRFNPKWTNVDFSTTGKNVIAHDLNKNIPFANETFDLVYHSHVLEHFSKAGAANFIQECCRVLRPGGVLRVVVPDLEQIARLYLTSLEKAPGSNQWAESYEWIALELLDQMVRNSRGGEMSSYLARSQHGRDFAVERFGTEAKQLITVPKNDHRLKSLTKEFRNKLAAVHHLLPEPLKRFYTAVKIGYYRQSGEVHQWMYDRYSLANLLQDCGLEEVVQRSATDSYILEWTSFNLDTEPDGSVYKPDSLFMEAVKPIH